MEATKNGNGKTPEPLNRLVTPVTETFGLSRTAALTSILVMAAGLVFAIYFFFHSAPPKKLTITSGPPGSAFETNAARYAEILKRNGVTLKILPSRGSEENLKRLDDAKFAVDVGFVQGGVTNAASTNAADDPKLTSLGSILYEPLFVFYRSAAPVNLLSEFKGKRLVIGAEGSGTYALARTLLDLNGISITNGATTIVDLDSAGAAAALTNGMVDAVFLMGDSASVEVLRQLLRAPEVQLLDFAQADAYTRRVQYLNKLQLPMGSMDFGRNIPPRDVNLVGPTVEILARPTLHPALCDLLLEAAREVNGKAGLFTRKAEFPAPIQHAFPISADATSFYNSGKKFLYKYMPFWLASLLNRMLVAFVPVVVVVIPGLRTIPALYKWRVRMLIQQRYRALLALERELALPMPDKQRAKLLERFDDIELAVNKMKVPASFADQFYGLRGHIDFVRGRMSHVAQSN